MSYIKEDLVYRTTTEPDGVVRHFQIQENPDPTDEELAKQDGFPRDITFPEFEEKLYA